MDKDCLLKLDEEFDDFEFDEIEENCDSKTNEDENEENYESDVNDDGNEEDCDSDINDEDEPSFTRGRLARKMLRHQSRMQSVSDVISLTGNLEFKAKITEYYNMLSIQTRNKNNSSLKKAIGHLMEYPDSWLTYMSNEDQNFRLSHLTDFKSNNFVALSYPLEWLNWLKGTENPSRAIEALKAFSLLRSFIKHKADKFKFGGSDADLVRKNMVFEGLKNVDSMITETKLYSKYQILANQGCPFIF